MLIFSTLTPSLSAYSLEFVEIYEVDNITLLLCSEPVEEYNIVGVHNVHGLEIGVIPDSHDDHAERLKRAVNDQVDALTQVVYATVSQYEQHVIHRKLFVDLDVVFLHSEDGSEKCRSPEHCVLCSVPVTVKEIS